MKLVKVEQNLLGIRKTDFVILYMIPHVGTGLLPVKSLRIDVSNEPRMIFFWTC